MAAGADQVSGEQPDPGPPGPAPSSHEMIYRLGRSPTILHVSSQHASQVGQSHSISPSGPRGWVAPHRHRISAPIGTLRSRRSMACLRPASGIHANDRGFGYDADTDGGAPSQVRYCPTRRSGVSEPGGLTPPFAGLGGIPNPGGGRNAKSADRRPRVRRNRVSSEVRSVPLQLTRSSLRARSSTSARIVLPLRCRNSVTVERVNRLNRAVSGLSSYALRSRCTVATGSRRR